MSMRSYAFRYYGVIVRSNEVNLQAIADEFNKKENPEQPYTVEDVSEWIDTEEMEVGNGGNIVNRSLFSSDLEGDFINLFSGNQIPIDVTNDDWAIFELPTYPSLFKAAYKDKDDLIQQVKELYGPYLKDAEHFDWHVRLIRLDGVVYG